MTDFRFLGTLPSWVGVLLAIALSVIAWWLYRREVHDLSKPYHWLLPFLRATAIGLALLMLLEPSVHQRRFEGQPGKVRILIDGTSSMKVADEPNPSVNPRSRYDRAVAALLEGETPLLRALSDSHEVAVSRLSASQQSLLWESTIERSGDLPNEAMPWQPDSWSGPTRIGEWLLLEASNRLEKGNELAVSSEQGGSSRPLSSGPIVLMTDGQNNAGPTPLDLVDRFKEWNRPIYVVGMGLTDEPQDLGLVSIDYPKQVFQSDTLRGSILFKDRIPPGQPIRLSIRHADRVVWEEEIVSQNTGSRSCAFAISVRELAEKQLEHVEHGLEFSRLPIELTAKIEMSEGSDFDPLNNSMEVRFSASTRRQRVLMLDSRSRWETRYLRNALERDPNWTVDAYLIEAGQPPRWYSQTTSEKPFPSSSEAWLEYDLIVTGEIEPNSLNATQMSWMTRAIAGSGCGWIVIDGNRGTWRDPSLEPLRKMFPVERIEEELPSEAAWTARPVDAGVMLSALQLSNADHESNQALWVELPKFRSATNTRPLPGAEELVRLEFEQTTIPWMVTRQFGAGRIAYFASDETWRWRYQVADLHHQKFWNQVARWSMRLPFAIEGEFLSLDAGDPVYELGDTIPIRARLKDSNGMPASSDWVEAMIAQNDRTISTIPLEADGSFPGVYRGSIDRLPPGKYQLQIQAAGFQRDALRAKADWIIVEPLDPEMQELACNSKMLEELAERSGGRYLPEDRVQELLDLLAPWSQGKIVESDILLWQSYLWFLPIIALLAAEWWLRKRAGLV